MIIKNKRELKEWITEWSDVEEDDIDKVIDRILNDKMKPPFGTDYTAYLHSLGVSAVIIGGSKGEGE